MILGFLYKGLEVLICHKANGLMGNLRTVNSRAFTDCTAVRLLCRYTLIAI